MADLVRLFEAAGCENVRTYIASGNVVFEGAAKVVKGLAAKIAGAIDKKFGLHVPVVIRSAEEMAAVARLNPHRKADPDSLYVMFLADEPGSEHVSSLDPNRSPGDVYKVVKRDIYLCLTRGAADTKLTNAYFDSKLKTVSTGRNWRTVQKLIEMCEEET